MHKKKRAEKCTRLRIRFAGQSRVLGASLEAGHSPSKRVAPDSTLWTARPAPQPRMRTRRSSVLARGGRRRSHRPESNRRKLSAMLAARVLISQTRPSAAASTSGVVGWLWGVATSVAVAAMSRRGVPAPEHRAQRLDQRETRSAAWTGLRASVSRCERDALVRPTRT